MITQIKTYACDRDNIFCPTGESTLSDAISAYQKTHLDENYISLNGVAVFYDKYAEYNCLPYSECAIVTHPIAPTLSPTAAHGKIFKVLRAAGRLVIIHGVPHIRID